MNYFSKVEKGLWGGSVLLIVLAFCIFDRESYLTLAASLIGVTSLIFNAKGNPVSQVLMIIFSVLYGVISYSFSYYGEMVTYMGMTMPMALIALVTWLRNPYQGNKAEVTVHRVNRFDIWIMCILTIMVTVIFYFILKHFHTNNLIPSTLSVTTSFMAVYLTARRSPYYAVAYGANDVILIVLWTMAALEDISYVSVLVCFVAFLANDIYGFISWKRMEKRQNSYNTHFIEIKDTLGKYRKFLP